MKLMRPRTFVIFALAALSGAVLLHTSQSVQKSEERLEALELSKYREQEKIRMLRAEWETLNRPERLEKLANEFLEMIPPSPEQMAKDPDPLPAYQVEETIPPEAQFDTHTPKLYEATVPVPSVKPSAKPSMKATQSPARNIPKATEVLKSKEKAKNFDDLIGELGNEDGTGGAP